MAVNRNPLQPWQPERPGDQPEPIRISAQSWSTPPQGHPPEPRGMRPDQWVVVILWLNLVAVGLIAWKKLPPSHLPQITAMLVALALGLGLGISLARHWGWFVRLFWVLVGVGAAVAAGLFVPSTGGMNLWHALRQGKQLVEELNGLPPGDTPRYQEILAAKGNLVAQYPEFQEYFHGPGAAWVGRSVPRWEADLNQLAPGDLAGLEKLRAAYQPVANDALDAAELAWFERSYQELKPGDFTTAGRLRAAARHTGNWDQPVQSGEEAWAERTVEEVLKETGPLLAKEPAQVSARLQQVARDLEVLAPHEVVLEKLLTARRAACRECLAGAQREVLGLVARERFLDAAEVAQQFRKAFEAEAQAVKMGADLNRFADSCLFLADLAVRAGRRTPAGGKETPVP
jgi:hypothetical protein